MTVAVDIQTGKVVGQLVLDRVPADTPHTPISGQRVSLLTADGYVTVPTASVRLEKV